MTSLDKNITSIIENLKSQILISRYNAAKLANKELVKLYFSVGKFIDVSYNDSEWGSKVLENISDRLQIELPGLRGFSASNMKRMRYFYIAYAPFFSIRPTLSDELGEVQKEHNFLIRPTVSDELGISFFCISFSHHLEIIKSVKKIEEREFYIVKTAVEYWSVRTLRFHLKSKLYDNEGKLPNNFSAKLPSEISNKAIHTFKDEYLLDFINIEDGDDEIDERELEHRIVNDIRKFMLSLGNDFSFIGNQYRMIVEEQEYFIDLLFFNRKLRSLVAIELKKGKFKPEYMGKMNFYLSALDENVKQSFENPSIGIILCKEKNNKIVEFSFKDTTKAMGVATFESSNKLPKQFKGILPTADELKKLL